MWPNRLGLSSSIAIFPITRDAFESGFMADSIRNLAGISLANSTAELARF